MTARRLLTTRSWITAATVYDDCFMFSAQSTVCPSNE